MKEAHYVAIQLRLVLLCVTFLLLLGSILAACDSHPQQPTAHASPTPNARATAFAHVTQTVQAEQQGPVTVQVTAQVRGSVAAQNLLLTVQVSVRNTTSLPIHLAGGTCDMPYIQVTLAQIGSSQPLRQFPRGDNCVLGPGLNDSPGIVPGGFLNSTLYFPLVQYYSTWPTGQYILTATVTLWHQGTLDQISTPTTTLLSGTAQGQTIVALA